MQPCTRDHATLMFIALIVLVLISRVTFQAPPLSTPFVSHIIIIVHCYHIALLSIFVCVSSLCDISGTLAKGDTLGTHWVTKNFTKAYKLYFNRPLPSRGASHNPKLKASEAIGGRKWINTVEWRRSPQRSSAVWGRNFYIGICMSMCHYRILHNPIFWIVISNEGLWRGQ